MTASHHEDAQQIPHLTPAELALQRKLKMIVIGLGLLIVFALAAIVAGMIYRASRIGKTESQPVAAKAQPAAALLPDVRLALPRGSEVRSTSLQGSRLVVHHEGPSGPGLVIVDLATGAVVSRVTIERER